MIARANCRVLANVAFSGGKPHVLSYAVVVIVRMCLSFMCVQVNEWLDDLFDDLQRANLKGMAGHGKKGRGAQPTRESNFVVLMALCFPS